MDGRPCAEGGAAPSQGTWTAGGSWWPWAGGDQHGFAGSVDALRPLPAPGASRLAGANASTASARRIGAPLKTFSAETVWPSRDSAR